MANTTSGYVGDLYDTNQCGRCRIIAYFPETKRKDKIIGAKCEVEFLRKPNYRTICFVASLKRGEVKDPYFPTPYTE